MEIKKILFATDFSEGSLDSLPYAVDFAKRYGAKLYLIHVIYDVVKPQAGMCACSLDEMHKEMQKDAKVQLEKTFIDEMRGFKDIEHVVLTGVPYQEIARFAKDEKIDLIVIGTHGRTGLDRMLFGSTQNRLYGTPPVLSLLYGRSMRK